MGWVELKLLQESGYVDIQSHGHSHGYYYVNDTIVDFNRLKHWAVAWPTDGDIRIGIPLYESSPSLIARRYFDDPKLRDVLANYAAKPINRLLLKLWPAAWERRLYTKAQESRRRIGEQGRYESSAEYSRRIQGDLRHSLGLLNSMLKKDCLFLSYPAGKFNSQLIQMVKRTGFRAAFTNILNKGSHYGSYALGRINVSMNFKAFVRNIRSYSYKTAT
jgi:hypothetical protein